MKIISPGILISRVTPMKPILCIVAGQKSIGMALSDAYLGSASPLDSIAGEERIHEAVCEYNVGALAFALAMRPDTNGDRFRSALMESLRKPSSSSRTSSNLMACVIDEQLSLSEVKQMARDEVEQWENVAPLIEDRQIGRNDHNLSLDAAAALNCFLWLHTGGWRNTFG